MLYFLLTYVHVHVHVHVCMYMYTYKALTYMYMYMSLCMFKVFFLPPSPKEIKPGYYCSYVKHIHIRNVHIYIYIYIGSLTELLTRHHSFVVCWMKEVDHVHAVPKKVLWLIANYVLNAVKERKE